MEEMSPFSGYLNNLWNRASELALACCALDSLFEEEANRLSREDEVQRLEAMCNTVLREIEEERGREDSARHASSMVDSLSPIAGLAVKGILGAATKGRFRKDAFDEVLKKQSSIKVRSFGTVMVRIGSGGLPDDVKTISISRLARGSNRSESEIIRQLREDGDMLLDRETFTLLIIELVKEVRSGQLHLPISRERVSETRAKIVGEIPEVYRQLRKITRIKNT